MHHSHKQETIQTSFNRWRGKQNVVYAQWNTTQQQNGTISDLQECGQISKMVLVKTADTKVHTVHGSIYMAFLIRHNQAMVMEMKADMGWADWRQAWRNLLEGEGNSVS